MDSNKQSFRMIAKTFSGLEEVLAIELKELGAGDVEIIKRGVAFVGDTYLLYKANYWCRTALRILKPIATFEARNEDDLYRQVGKIRWWELMNVNDTLAVDSVVGNSSFRHSKYVALKTKDAIVDQFRRKYNERPSIDTKNPVLRINVHIYKQNCTISLDSSGSSLHLRGYRTQIGQAPINEVLAAGLILLSGWDKESTFIDPMCGSGTFLIEAVMIAKNIPASYYRKDFGFRKWKDFDKACWETILGETFKMKKNLSSNIMGSDISKESITTARTNVSNTNFKKEINLLVSPITKFKPPAGGGIVITNPPYGERMNQDDIKELYKHIGDTLKQKYDGYNVWIISSDFQALKLVGLRPSKKIPVFNGPLECKFAKFEIYEGSRKTSKQLKE